MKAGLIIFFFKKGCEQGQITRKSRRKHDPLFTEGAVFQVFYTGTQVLREVG